MVAGLLSTNNNLRLQAEVARGKAEAQLVANEVARTNLIAAYEVKLTAQTNALSEKESKLATAQGNERNLGVSNAKLADQLHEYDSMWGSAKLFFNHFWAFLLGAGTLVLIVYIVYRIADAGLHVASLANPAIAAGVSVFDGIRSKVRSRMAAELTAGGEAFKERVPSALLNLTGNVLPGILEKVKSEALSIDDAVSTVAAHVSATVLDEFSTAHQKAQSQDTQQAVKRATS